MSSEEVKPRVERRMALIDSQPPAIRALVHEYGWNVVKAFLDAGVTKPNQIKHCIHVVRHDLGTVLHEQRNGD
jgi:hypothetical protein